MEDAQLGICHSMPGWVSKLLTLGKEDFPPEEGTKAEALKARLVARAKKTSFVVEVPLWFIDLGAFATPGVWPLQGTVLEIAEHFYKDTKGDEILFPGRGNIMEVAYFKHPLDKEEIGKFHRENGDTMLLAWLHAYGEAKSAGQKEVVKKFAAAAAHIACKFNLRESETERRLSAYQFKEDEDKAGDRLGHSPLCRARELFSLQELQRPRPYL